MNDQIKVVENLMEANKATKPRTAFLEVALGALTTARDNMKEHVAELGRQVEARRVKLAEAQKQVQELQGQVEEDKAPAKVEPTATKAKG